MTIEQKLSDLGFSKYFILYNGSWMIYTYDSCGRVDSGFKDTLLKAVNKLGLIVKQRREQMAMFTHVGGEDGNQLYKINH